jgi:hypothetical protein
MSEIELLEVDVERVGQPRNDGTAGSGLYRVPIKLSARPTTQWSEIFVALWDHPPRFTTMHRPGIASVQGDRVVLNGTTVDEVRDVHAKTLKLVVEETNRRAAEVEDRQRAEAAAKQREPEAHSDEVRRVADEIDFEGTERSG